MASIFPNVGLVDLWRAALNAVPAPGSSPRIANLITAAFIPSSALIYGALSWAAAPGPVNVQSLWSFALQAGANYCSAVANVVWTFPAGDAGLIFYGTGLYDPITHELFYVESFPAPFVVAATGSTLNWTFNLNYGDCSQLP